MGHRAILQLRVLKNCLNVLILFIKNHFGTQNEIYEIDFKMNYGKIGLIIYFKKRNRKNGVTEFLYATIMCTAVV